MNIAPSKPVARYLPRLGFALVCAIVVLGALFALQPNAAEAQQAGVSIASINCSIDPEVVTILNTGDDSVDLSGWHLESDPAESFDLSPIQTLAPGSSVTIEAGPAASGTFVWSADEVLRDDDHTDYARIVDENGSTVDEEACAAAPTSTPPADDMPNGGGPPAPTSGSPMLFVFAGLGLSTGALALLAISLVPLGRGISSFVGGSTTGRGSDRGPVAASSPPVASDRATPIVQILGIALLFTLLIALALRGRGSR
jgi:hypothetical protein